MDTIPKNYRRPVTEHRGIRLSSIDLYIHSTWDQLNIIEESVVMLSNSGKEDSENSSFDEGIFSRLQSSIKEVHRLLKDLNSLAVLINKEEERCRYNIEQISADAPFLNNDRIIQKYKFAKLNTEFQYKQIQLKKRELKDLIWRVKQSLIIAKAQKVPGENKKGSKADIFSPPPRVNGPFEAQSSDVKQPVMPPPGIKGPFNAKESIAKQALNPPLPAQPSNRLSGRNSINGMEFNKLMSIGPLGSGKYK